MPSYSDRDKIQTDDIGDFGTTITYSILNDKNDLLAVSHYGDQSAEFSAFSTGTTYIQSLNDLAILIMSGDPYEYSVTFSDVTAVAFTNTGSGSGGTGQPPYLSPC